MKPHYAQVSRLVKENELSKNVQVLALDCDGFGRDICRKQYNVKNFPTMHFYYPKQNVEYKRKYSKRRSTVVDISITSLSSKPVSLS